MRACRFIPFQVAAFCLAYRLVLPVFMIAQSNNVTRYSIALSSFMPHSTSHSELSLPTLSLHLIIFTVASNDLIQAHEACNNMLAPNLFYFFAAELAAYAVLI